MPTKFCEDVAFIDGARSGFAVAGQHFAGMPIYQMAREVGEALVRRNMLAGDLNPEMIDRVIFGSTVPDQQSRVPARDIVLESPLFPKSVAGISMAMFCTTGFATASAAVDAILGSIARANDDVRLVD